ncbi:MAG: NAD(P)-binding domain-containing protein [Bacteroidales bacterium]|jgi:thioredoxin reductase/Pyruvate/2-oxoacid:ferredoxin oxidoreductase delta subunit
MEVLIEKIITYSVVVILIGIALILYVRKQKRDSKIVEEKIRISKEEGIHEPVSLHPVVDVNSCIRTGACISACPEHDILGIRNGKATIINASHCVGHGACFHACPVEAITLCIGTEKRGVDLPHVNQTFESNVTGIYIAGEIGGMGLIKNAVAQGKQAVENLVKTLDKTTNVDYDLVIVGAGPAGIAASLTAKKNNLKVLTLEQDSLGGTVFNFPRTKIVMTSPMDLPLYGKVKLNETTKQELLSLWEKVLAKNSISIVQNTKVESIVWQGGHFEVGASTGESFSTKKVLLAIGRRGTPRKLNISGEELEKTAYRLLEPEIIENKKVMVVGGGDSAIESALQLMDKNTVHLAYRSDAFGRIKPKNSEKIKKAMADKLVTVLFNTNLTSIEKDFVNYKTDGSDQIVKLQNDLVYILAGGELPTAFLEKSGILITRKFGEAILKHEK